MKTRYATPKPNIETVRIKVYDIIFFNKIIITVVIIVNLNVIHFTKLYNTSRHQKNTMRTDYSRISINQAIKDVTRYATPMRYFSASFRCRKL